MNIRYQDIVLIDFDPTRWKEIQKTRPAIVVSSNVINEKSPFCITIPLTTNLKYQNVLRVLIKQNKINGLSEDSVAICDQIKSLDQSRISKKLGEISVLEMRKIQEGIDVAVNRY